MVNVYKTKLDIKAVKHVFKPVFVQYDHARLEIELLDGGLPYSLTNVSRVEFTHVRKDGAVIIHPGEIVTIGGKSIVCYDYQGTEMDELGVVQASFALFNAENRKVSPHKFEVVIRQDLRDETFNPAEPNYGLLQTLIADVEYVKENGGSGGVGLKGDKGDTGPQGLRGEKGETGDRGPQGLTGPKGDKGDTGLAGTKGDKGEAGYTPVKGVDYFDGVSGRDGAQGPKGDPGSTEIRQNVIPNTISKIKVGLPISVCVMGDSLAEGDLHGENWVNILFGANYNNTRQPHPLNLHDKYGANFSVTNMAIGGHAANLVLAQLGFEKQKPLKIGAYINQEISSPNVIMPPTLQNYDLFIISMGTNGGHEHDFVAENVVKILHNANKDVIITTSNPRTDNVNFADYIENRHSNLAEFYRVGLANTNAYYKKAISDGTAIADLNRDAIHQNERGHELYAQAIIEVIENSYDAKVVKHKNQVRNRLINHSDLAFTNIAPISSELQLPLWHNGTTQNIELTDARNPFYGRYNSVDMIKLEVGQRVKFASDNAYSFDIIYYEDVETNGKVQIKFQDGNENVADPIQLGGGVAYYRAHLANGLAKAYYAGVSSVNRSFVLECTEGTVKILGVVFNSYATKELTTPIKKIGTFNTIDLYGNTCLVSDDDSMYVEGYFYGEGIKMNFLTNRSGQIIDIYIDNVLVRTFDTYSHLQYEHQVATLVHGGLFNGKHYFKVKFNDAKNSNSIDPSSGDIPEHKFMLQSISSFVNRDLNLLNHI